MNRNKLITDDVPKDRAFRPSVGEIWHWKGAGPETLIFLAEPWDHGFKCLYLNSTSTINFNNCEDFLDKYEFVRIATTQDINGMTERHLVEARKTLSQR